MDVLIYIAKSTAILTLFYLVYYFLLREDTLFTAKRFFFIFGIIATIALPFAQFTTIIEVETPAISSNIDFDSMIPFQEATFSAPATAIEQPFNWWQMSLVFYLIGMGFFLIRFMTRLISLKSLLKKHTYKKIGTYKYVTIKDKISPFSIFNYIVFNPTQHHEKELEMILKHEEVHARQWHSLDIIFGQLITIIQWANPFSYAFKKAIEENLEFIADSQTVHEMVSKKEYQYALVNASSPITVPALTSPFYQSLIKKRIVMLNKKTSHKHNVLKASFVLPLLAIFLYSFNVKEEISYINTIENKTTKTEFSLLPTSTDADIDEIERYFSTEISNTFVKISNLKRDENDLIQSFDFQTQFEGQEEFYTRFSQNKSKKTLVNTYKGHTINYADGAINVSGIGPKATSFIITAEQLKFVNTEYVVANTNNENLTITAEISESQLNAIEIQLENMSDAFEIDFKDRKRNAEGKLMELSIDTKYNNQTRYNKNATYGGDENNKAIPSLLLNVVNDELQFGDIDGILLNKITPDGVIGITFPRKEKENIAGEKMGDNPLYIINGKHYLKIALPADTHFEVSESIEILNPREAKVIYGNIAKDGAIVFKGITTFKKDVIAPKIDTTQIIKKIIPKNTTTTDFREQKQQIIDQHGVESGFIDSQNIKNEKQEKGLFERFKNTQGDLKRQPLFIVDGIEMDQSFETKKLLPDNIESVTVLNEKYQIKKYGEKGKNGVVIIILKKKE